MEESFGKLLRELRVAAGLSQEQLAERARLSSGAISTLERSARRAPQHQTLLLLAEALRLEPSGRGRRSPPRSAPLA
jgi:transcriptional regulator with XRE-family HTH domain